MNDDQKTGVLIAAAAPILFGLLILTILPFALWQAFVGVHLYEWFVRPLGPVFPKITFWGFYGLSLFVNVIRTRQQTDEKHPFRQLFVGAAVLASVLLIGWIVKGWA